MCLPPSGGKRYRGSADAVFQNLDMIEKSSAEYVLIVSGDQVYHMDINDSDDFGKSILPVLIRSGRAVVFQFGGYWRDVGTLDGYYQTNLDLLLAGAALDP